MLSVSLALSSLSRRHCNSKDSVCAWMEGNCDGVQSRVQSDIVRTQNPPFPPGCH